LLGYTHLTGTNQFMYPIKKTAQSTYSI
jgi:hypothetical protein